VSVVDEFTRFLFDVGVREGQHLLVHAAFRRTRAAFPGISIEGMLDGLEHLVTPRGSVIILAFSYCFKRVSGKYTIFSRDRTPAVIEAVSEVFRSQPSVIRTSSPTHSFSFWGKAAVEIGPHN